MRQGKHPSLAMLVLLAAVILPPSALAARDDIIFSAKVLRYDPSPAEPGNVVDVWIEFSNTGTQVEKIQLAFVPEYPFSLPEGQPGSIDVGFIAPTESKVVKLTLFVAQDAPNGERNVTFRYTHSGIGEVWAELEAPITLRTHDARVVIDDYAVLPERVVPGQTATLDVTLRNIGRIGVKNLDLDLETDSAVSIIGSGSRKRVTSVPAGGTSKVSYTLIADPTAASKVHTISFNVSYQDERNRNVSDRQRIGIQVGAVPEVTVLLEQVRFDKADEPGTISLKVVNKGVTDVKFVTVSLKPNTAFELLDPSGERYVGNLDSDDFESVDYKIQSENDQLALDVVVSYKDQFNTDVTLPVSLPLRIVPAADLEPREFPTTLVAVGVIGALLVLAWWLRRRKK